MSNYKITTVLHIKCLLCSQVKEPEISGYVSDGEDIGSPVTSSRLDSEIFPFQTGEGSKKSISNWVRSAQAMLQTPQKPVNRQPKTPEDSAKKRRKFQRCDFCSSPLFLNA